MILSAANRLRALLLLTLALAATPAHAQDFSVQSIGSINLGNVVSGTTDNTVFRLNPDNGNVIQNNGTGYRLSSGSARALVTVFCTTPGGGAGGPCANENALITIARSGTPTNRARPLRAFRVSTNGATATIPVEPAPATSISFEIGPVGKNLTKTFWVGFNFVVAGDDSGDPTGLAGAGFSVTIATTSGGSPNTLSSTAFATVFRPIVVSAVEDMSFGTISRPRSGAGSVTLDPADGSRAIVGLGAEALPLPAHSLAEFAVEGEGGQAISIDVPSSFTLSGPGPDLTVTTDTIGDGAQLLSNALGSEGNHDVQVGGTLPFDDATPVGNYTGNLVVTVQYN